MGFAWPHCKDRVAAQVPGVCETWYHKSITAETSTRTCRALQTRLEDLVISTMSVIQYAIFPSSHAQSTLTLAQTLANSQPAPPSLNNRTQTMPTIQTTAPPNNVGQPGPPGPPYSAAPPPGPGTTGGYAPALVAQNGLNGSPQNQNFPPPGVGGPPQLPPAQVSTPLYAQPPTPMGALQSNNSNSSLPSLRPVFGVSLEDLLKRDGSAIPLVVYQCIQAVDLFGLEVEGIYRLSGSATHVSRLKAIFDNGV